MKTLNSNFKPNNAHTQDFIKEKIIPKLNSKLPVVQEASQDELVLAVSAFFAHGLRDFFVDYSVNPLFEEVCSKLVEFGYLRPDSTRKNVFRVSLPNSRLEFVTVNREADQPKVDTSYKTRYADGSFNEVDRDDITFVEGYPAITWEVVNPELQVAYATGKQDQPTKQYLSLDKEKLVTSFLKADKEELADQHEKFLQAAVSAENVWRYKDGLISTHLPYIEKAVNQAAVEVFGKADFKFLAEIKQNNRQGEIETVESVGGST